MFYDAHVSLATKSHAFYDVLVSLALENNMSYDVFVSLAMKNHAFYDVFVQTRVQTGSGNISGRPVVPKIVPRGCRVCLGAS